MDIFAIDFLKDFCYAKFISKTLLLRNYVQEQPHPTGAVKIKLLHSFRRGELRFFFFRLTGQSLTEKIC